MDDIYLKLAKKVMYIYDKKFPEAKKTLARFSHVAATEGEIRTLLNRRVEFNMWENSEDPKAPILPGEKGIREYGNYARRYGTYRALNYTFQGGAADLFKKAMIDCWLSGVFDETGVPRLLVHDEIVFSDPGDKDEAFAKMKHIMETALKLKVPIKVVEARGSNWGNVKDIK